MSIITFMKDLLKTAARPKTGCGACVQFEHLHLPPVDMRQCTAEFRDDEYFMASAEREVYKLAEHCGLSNDSRVLEIGCGSGRLPIGLLSARQLVRSYDGLDVDRDSIKWCDRWIGAEHSAFRFHYIDVHNERYNPNGAVRLDDGFRFEFPAQQFDVIYLYSVFTHMQVDDIKVYLRECKRVLSPTGNMFLTAYLEDDVPNASINPPGYRQTSRGPLHRVRLNRAYFSDLLKPLGLRMFRFDHRGEFDQQSGIYLARA